MIQPYIANEIPSGVVDGVNKIFTTTQNIYKIDTIWLGGAPYFNYTWDGNTITLQDAPLNTWTQPIILNYYTSPDLFGTSGNLTILDCFNLLVDEGEIDTNDLPPYARWCNELNQMIYRFDREKNISKYVMDSTFTMVASQAEYIKPDNFLTINGTNLGIFEAVGSDYLPLAETKFGDSSEGFYFEGSKVAFTPTPATSGKQYKFRYLPILDKITADDDTLIISDEYTEMVANYMLKRYWLWAKNPGKSSIYDFAFDRNLNEFLENYGQKKNTRKIYNNNNIY